MRYSPSNSSFELDPSSPNDDKVCNNINTYSKAIATAEAISFVVDDDYESTNREIVDFVDMEQLIQKGIVTRCKLYDSLEVCYRH